MEGTEKEETGRNEDFGGRIPNTSGKTEKREEELREEPYEEDQEIERERERLRRERKERREKRQEKRKKERNKKLLLCLLLLAALFCVVFLLRGFGNLEKARTASSSNLTKELNLTIVKKISEEEKNALMKQAEERQGLVLHFLSPDTDENKTEEQIRNFRTDILLTGDGKNAKLLSAYSEKAKTPVLFTSYLPKESMGDYSFCLGKSAEDQAVDLSFFAYNEAFRSIGILEPEGSSSALSQELSEAFQILGGTSRILQYSSMEDMKAKEAELENTGADLLFLEEYSEEGVAFLSEEHNLPVLLGEDWDRNDFPGETVLKTSSYLYGKDTLASSPNIAEPKESVSEEESREEGSRERDALKLAMLAMEKSGKSWEDKLEGLDFQGTYGEYQLIKGGYALHGRPVFYEIAENKRVVLSR